MASMTSEAQSREELVTAVTGRMMAKDIAYRAIFKAIVSDEKRKQAAVRVRVSSVVIPSH
jgi:hypothetical protein